jgi:hypothetical protein
MAGGNDGGEARRTQAVERHPGDGLGQPREQRPHARDIAVVLAGLVGGAEVDVLDLAGLDPGTLNGSRDRRRREVIGPDVGKGAAVAPNRRPDGG